jgi:L-ascorbate metabolism protein UlaG (beta-lactamase superfamily)
MSTVLTWLGHCTWSIKTAGQTILLDPFLDENPAAPVKSEEVEADFILVSHGHFDHVADVAAIAHRTGATVVAIYEIAEWFSNKHGVKSTLGMNIGGGVDLPFGRVKLTPALHSSQLPDGCNGGNPGGFLLTLPEGKIYFACDTGLFSDMRLIGAAGIDLAVLPIGDLFTMGPDDSIEAIRLIQPRRVVPSHYNTWPPIAQDAQAWAQRVRQETAAEPLVLPPGGTVTL